MNRYGRTLILFVALVAATFAWGGPRAVVAQAPQFACLPTCSSTDARFLSIAGTRLNTLVGADIDLKVAVPGSSTTVDIGIFDGNSSGIWDLTAPGTTGSPLTFTLFTDPDGDGVGDTQIAQWQGDTMPDNAWFDQTLPNDPGALSPSGYYLYVLRVQMLNPTGDTWSNFKVRTSSALAVISPDAFAFTAPLYSLNEVDIIYPDFSSTGDLTNTTYDGTWAFTINVPETSPFLEIWDGDFDRGSFDNTDLDTDDPNTPGAPFVPPWAGTTTARPEGVAFVINCRTEPSATACPADDRSTSFFVRSPSIQYDVLFPNGDVYTNTNPSGNLEWELFRLDTTTADPTVADYQVGAVPPGQYIVRTQGVDLSNLNAWRMAFDVLAICEDGTVCRELPEPYLIGDTVWFDSNADGVQDPGEPGIPGVVVHRLDQTGAIVDTEVTDSNGLYFFDVPTGTHTVRVDAVNFAPGNPLEGLVSTTGGESQTDGISLDYDFGYVTLGELGDRVWFDSNGDGVQDTGENGIPSVTLELYDGQGSFLASDVTDSDGIYGFSGLAPDTYTVVVVTQTLPSGLQQTYDLDGLVTPHQATIFLPLGGSNLDVDFGYQPLGTIGDYVWIDTNGDGVQDPGESPIPGVTVRLLDGSGAPVGTDVTDSNGLYLFPNLPADTYTVEVDPTTLPPGLSPTFDFDGIATPNVAQVPLAVGEVNLDVDFGYRADFICVFPQLIDFDTTATGAPMAAGDIVTNQYAPWGVSFSTNDPANHPLMVFDSANPTGLDYDLGTPNRDFGGPGRGPGGAAGTPGENSRALGNVLIISEDNDPSDPDDNVGGGLVIADFQNPVDIEHLSILDIDEFGMGTVAAYDATGALIASASMANLGDNSYQLVTLRATGVSRLVVTFPSSGALDEIQLCVDEPPPPPTGTIGDRVWRDIDGDGLQEPGEGGIRDVTVNLFDAGGTVIATEITDDNGVYLFTDLPAGDYTVVVDDTTLPVGLTPTYDLDGIATPHRASLTLATGATNLDVDFGYQPDVRECGECEGKITEMTLRYTGATLNAHIVVVQKKPEAVVFDGIVMPGQSFSFEGVDKHGTLSTEISIYVNGQLATRIHTSCSQPVNPGLSFGDFLIVAAESRGGGPICPVTPGISIGELISGLEIERPARPAIEQPTSGSESDR